MRIPSVSEMQAILDMAQEDHASAWTDGRIVTVDVQEKQTHRMRLMRNGGHPEDGRQGWDRMEFDRVTSPDVLQDLLRRAELAFWRVWSQTATSAVLYKPSGARAPWGESIDMNDEQMVVSICG